MLEGVSFSVMTFHALVAPPVVTLTEALLCTPRFLPSSSIKAGRFLYFTANSARISDAVNLQALSQIPGTIIHFDNIALCVENNLYSAVTTLRTLINNFNAEDIRYLNMKSKLVITKYNDESMYNDEILTPERLAELMTDNICDDFIDVLEIAGEIPYMVDFDRQIERDVLIYETSSLMMKSYDKVLTRL